MATALCLLVLFPSILVRNGRLLLGRSPEQRHSLASSIIPFIETSGDYFENFSSLDVCAVNVTCADGEPANCPPSVRVPLRLWLRVQL